MRYHKELLGEVIEKDKWRDNLRALPEKLASAERVTDKVTEVLSFLILGHLRRTVQEKGKKQQDLRRFILQSCSLIGRDFLVAFVDHVVREAAPQGPNSILFEFGLKDGLRYVFLFDSVKLPNFDNFHSVGM